MSADKVRKKVAEEVRVVLENGVRNNHRSFILVLGSDGVEKVQTIHGILTKIQASTPPSILWCYKSKMQFSSNKEKRSKDFKKYQANGLLNEEVASQINLFLEGNKIRYCKYHDTANILGKTYGMLVLQDFQDITPNILARTIETVSGGGTIVMLLDKITDIRQVHTMTMGFHKKMADHSFGTITNRFVERFIKSLPSCGNFVAIDGEYNLLKGILEKPHIETFESSDAELLEIKAQVRETEFVGPIIDKVVTIGQAQTVMAVMDIMGAMELNKVIGITASRGRGKSAALGLSLAFAVAKGYSNIFVTAPSSSNVSTLFEFAKQGLEAIGYKDGIDFNVKLGQQKEIVWIDISKSGHRQTICYVKPTDHQKLGNCEILAIDEAAAIPLPVVRKLLGPYIVLLSSTVNGYEGTGRALSLKLFEEFKKKGDGSFKKIEMTAPIRYADKDPIEKWLNTLLCLNAEPVPIKSMPFPALCKLVLVNRDHLFSGHKTCEKYLNSIVALSVASHYKNEPDDLILMSDAPNHQIYALMTPVESGEGAVKAPNVIAFIQVALEGNITEQQAIDAGNRGHNPDGNLIPWTVKKHCDDTSFTKKTGIRIVRIAVHPDMQGKGYGTAAIKQLLDYFRTPSPIPDDKKSTPFFQYLDTCPHEPIDWAGVSFGLTSALFNFWRIHEFKPVYVAHSPTQATGEHTCVVLQAIGDDTEWLDRHCADFRIKFGRLLPYEPFRQFAPKLVDEVIASIAVPDSQRTQCDYDHELFNELNIKRMRLFSAGGKEYTQVKHIVSQLAHFYFEKNPNIPGMTRLSRMILLIIGLQSLSETECAARIQIETNQVYGSLQKICKLFVDYFENIPLPTPGEPVKATSKE